MKRIIFTLSIYFLCLNFSSQAAQVNVLSGVNLRQSPSTQKSPVIAKLPFKTSVTIISSTKKTYTLGAFKGKWIKIKTALGTGYIVDLFISELPLPEEGTILTLNEYLTKYFPFKFSYEELRHTDEMAYSEIYTIHSVQLIDFYFLLRIFHDGDEMYLPPVLNKGKKEYSNDVMVLHVKSSSNDQFLFEWSFDGGSTTMQLKQLKGHISLEYHYYPD